MRIKLSQTPEERNKNVVETRFVRRFGPNVPRLINVINAESSRSYSERFFLERVSSSNTTQQLDRIKELADQYFDDRVQGLNTQQWNNINAAIGYQRTSLKKK